MGTTVADLFAKNTSQDQLESYALKNGFTAHMADSAIDVKTYGAIADGNSHPLSTIYATLAAAQVVYSFATALTDEIDYCALQKAINTANSLSGNIVELPPGIYVINKGIVIPKNAITLKGRGYYGRLKGTVIKWTGGNSLSVIKVNESNILEDFYIYNGNAATGVTAIDLWGGIGTEAIHIILKNLYIDAFDIGIAFNYAFYNSIQDCVAYQCNTGYKLGTEANNNGFTTCHTNGCGKGVLSTALNRTNKFTCCSFEGSTIVGVDLTNGKVGNFATGYIFDTCYFEVNKQTIILGGYNNALRNCFVNHDWITIPSNPTISAIEVFRGIGVELTALTFSADIPLVNCIAMTDIINVGNMANHAKNGLSISSCYGGSQLATLLYNNPGLATYGIISSKDITIIETDMIDASIATQSDINFIVTGDPMYTDKKICKCYIKVYNTIVVTPPFTVRVGYAGGAYDQIVNTSYSTNLAAGIYELPMLAMITINATHNLRIFNTANTSGKYKMVFVLAD